MSELKPCPHCGEPKQLEVVKIDFKNEWRDLIKCRHCRSQAMRKYWNTRDTSAIEAAVLRRVADGLLLSVTARYKDGLSHNDPYCISYITNAADRIESEGKS